MKLKLSLIFLTFIFVFLPYLSYAQETLTITTYYPSPYGSYNELKVASNTYLAYSSGSVGIPAGSHTVELVLVAGNADANDYSQVTVLELPF
jgi:hypothetical protein